jgi:hypothetical protein
MAEKRYENKEMQRHYERTRPKEGHGERANPRGEHHEPENEGDGAKDIHDVVAEHGPAEHVEIHSHHEDGHVHKAKHHDAQSAHQHIDTAMGQSETPGSANGLESPGGAPPMGGGGIPTMA